GNAATPRDAFVTKINAAGTAVLFSTYLGGSAADTAKAIAVVANGNAKVTGFTYSTDFPTLNPIQGRNAAVQYGCNVFVAKFGPAGTLAYSTYLGGKSQPFDNYDKGESIAVDEVGNAYVAGGTWSRNFPIVNALYPTSYWDNGNFSYSGFVAKLNLSGSALIYSTYYPADPGIPLTIAVDMAGNAYVGAGGNVGKLNA